MEHGSRLDDWLAAARSELAECGEPDLLAEQQLLARVRETRALQSVAATRIGTLPRRDHRTGFWHRLFSWRAAALAGAAMLAIAISALVLAPNQPQSDATVRTPFLALVASEAIAAEPSAVIVSSQVSGAELSDYGLPVDPERVDQPIRAEFLLSPTGLILAVRFAE
jgi:anti-sigma-K factor RskA